MEMGNVIEIASRPPIAQRSGGIQDGVYLVVTADTLG